MFEVVWWEQNWAAIKDLIFYGFWLGLGAFGAYYLAKTISALTTVVMMFAVAIVRAAIERNW